MQYLRNTWYVAMWSEQLVPGKLERREILGEPLVIHRAPDGGVVALQDRCPHRFAPLHLGKLQDNGAIECGYHGLHFDRHGSCIYNPHGKGLVPEAAKVRAYPAHEAHSLVWVWMGDKTPDASRIPDLSMIGQAPARYITQRDHLEMDANYQLVVDNLLDLSHTVILHRGVLGNADTASAQIRVDQRGDVVTVSRWMPSVRPPGLFDMLFRRDGEPADHWTDIRWMAPCYLVNDAGVTAPGADRAEGSGIYGLHLLTPVNERRTAYHFAAVRQNPMPFDDDIEADVMTKLTALRRQAFVTEDLPMIEAQQRNMDGMREPAPPVLLDVDSGTVRYRRILERLLAEDQAP